LPKDRGQYLADIDRYVAYRRLGIRYVQVTKEKLRNPRSVVREVHRTLVEGGFVGPAPEFGEQWDGLFPRLSRLVGRRGLPRD
jgi:hypothetical protein